MSAFGGGALDAASDTRLHDYLEDKLQTLADLESLDSLLASVKSQQELLRKQVQGLPVGRRCTQ